MEKKIYRVGTIGIAAKNLCSLLKEINEGEYVQIIYIDDNKISRGYDLMSLKTGIVVEETGFDSIIPVKAEQIKFSIGTKGIASRQLGSKDGIQKGEKVQIIAIENDAIKSKGYNLMSLNTGVIVNGTGFDSIIPNIDKQIEQDNPKKLIR